MTKSKLLGLAAILSAVIATPALAAGETATRPWSAPVGHRQPRAVDIPRSVSPQVLDQEDIDVDRKIRAFAEAANRCTFGTIFTVKEPAHEDYARYGRAVAYIVAGDGPGADQQEQRTGAGTRNRRP